MVRCADGAVRDAKASLRDDVVIQLIIRAIGPELFYAICLLQLSTTDQPPLLRGKRLPVTKLWFTAFCQRNIVLGAGLEPASLSAYAPQTYVSTSSTTRASRK